MDTQAVIQILNRGLSIEYAGVIQFLQAAALVQGPYKEVHEELFRQMSEGSWRHAGTLARWIVLLNGIPTLEPAAIRQSTDLTEMLRDALELERQALATYLEAHGATGGDIPLRHTLEQLAHDERLHIEELEKLLGQKSLTLTVKEVKLKAGA